MGSPDSLQNLHKQFTDVSVNETTFTRILYTSIKYIFIIVNVFALISSSWTLFGPNEAITWHFSNSLLILGLMFLIVLNFVALYGSIKEECYLILTYNLFISPIYLVAVIYKWRPIIELIFFGFYIALCYLFATLVYRKRLVI